MLSSSEPWFLVNNILPGIKPVMHFGHGEQLMPYNSTAVVVARLDAFLFLEMYNLGCIYWGYNSILS